MLENLGNRFQDIFKKIRGHGKLSESNIKDALREVKMSLLEADVNYKVVKDFTNRISEKAIGTEVIRGVNPAQQFIKLVNDELVVFCLPQHHSQEVKRYLHEQRINPSNRSAARAQ